MVYIDMDMPECCDKCFALDDIGDYPLHPLPFLEHARDDQIPEAVFYLLEYRSSVPVVDIDHLTTILLSTLCVLTVLTELVQLI